MIETEDVQETNIEGEEDGDGCDWFIMNEKHNDDDIKTEYYDYEEEDPINDSNDAIKTEFSDCKEPSIIYQRTRNKEEFDDDDDDDEEEEEEEEDDEEDYLLLRDVVIVDDVDSEENEFADLDRTVLNVVDDEDDDYGYSNKNELQSNESKRYWFHDQNRLEIQKSLVKVPDTVLNRHCRNTGRRLKEFRKIEEDNTPESSNQPNSECTSYFPSEVVTAQDNPSLVLGELIVRDALPPGKSKFRFKCGECGHLFRSRNKLSSHFRVHTREKPFPCTVCGKQFRERHHVVDHLRIHTGVRPFQCSICDSSFTRSHHLKRHLVSHQASKTRTTLKCKPSATINETRRNKEIRKNS